MRGISHYEAVLALQQPLADMIAQDHDLGHQTEVLVAYDQALRLDPDEMEGEALLA
jgi:hypothetical protein